MSRTEEQHHAQAREAVEKILGPECSISDAVTTMSVALTMLSAFFEDEYSTNGQDVIVQTSNAAIVGLRVHRAAKAAPEVQA